MAASDVLKRKQPRTRSVDVVLDEGLIAERDRLIAEISRQKRLESWNDSGDMSSPVPALQTELRQILAELESATATFEFQAVSRNEWNKAVEEYKTEDGTLGEDFEIWLVSRSSTGVNKLTAKQVKAMYGSDSWSAAETQLLWDAAYSVNREARDIPFTQAGIEQILSTGSNSTTADPEE